MRNRIKLLTWWKERGRPDVPANSASPTAPLPPTGLSYSNITNTSVTLSWTRSTSAGVTEQRVYTNKKKTNTLANTDTSVVISGLTAGTTYDFRVTAYNATSGLNSVYSNAVTPTTSSDTVPLVPDAPASLDGFVLSSTAVVLNWTAPAAGQALTGYYVFQDGVNISGALSSSTLSYQVNGLTANTLYQFTVKAYNASGTGPPSPAKALTTLAATQPKFAGHIPNRVLVGMAASEGSEPTFDDALAIINRNVNQGFAERRIFVGSAISTSGLNSMLNTVWSTDNRILPITSFKPTQSVAGMTAYWDGTMDASLDLIKNRAISERTANGGQGRPFMCTLYHEPAGDQPGGTTATDWLAAWSKMQQYCVRYFAGYRRTNSTSPWVYNSANDVRDILTWCSIMNGNKWGPRNVSTSEINAAHPQVMIDEFRTLGGVLMADFYDPTNSSSHTANTSANADRTSKKIQAYIDWHRQRNCGMLGCGEWSCTTTDEFFNAWAVVRANRDIFCIFNYFNSGANSKWEWRLIPDSYPQKGPQVIGGVTVPGQSELTDYGPGATVVGGKTYYVEIGGTPTTEANLNAYRQIIDESISPQYTGPVI